MADDVDIVVGARDLATRVLDSVGASTSRLQASVLKASVIMTGAFAAFQTVRGLASVFLDQVDAVDKLVTSAQKLGTTANELEGFRFALESIGNVEPGAADAILKNMAVNIGKQSKAFQELGLDIKKLSGGSTTAAFREITGALRGVTSDTKQAALAQQIFGRGGTELLPIIRGTAEQYEAAAGAATKLGTALTDIEIAQIQAADAALEQMQRSITGLVRSLTVELSPALVAISGGVEGVNTKAGILVQTVGKMVEGWGAIAALTEDIFGGMVTAATTGFGPSESAFFKYLDDLEAANRAAENVVPKVPTVADVDITEVADVDIADIVDKEEKARLASIAKLQAAEQQADVDRLDKFKKLQENVLADIQKEKDDIRNDNIEKTMRAIEDVRSEADALRIKQSERTPAIQAFESRLLTRAPGGSTPMDKVADNTKNANVLLKDIKAKLDEANRKEKADRELALTLVE